MAQLDPHSNYDTTQPRTRHIRLNWFVDFERHQIDGSVALELENPSSGYFDLDTKALTIHSASAQDGRAVACQLDDPDPILGAAPAPRIAGRHDLHHDSLYDFA